MGSLPDPVDVLVGDGSAGCVLANGLSADSRWRVWLAEAGSVMLRLPSADTEVPTLMIAEKVADGIRAV